LSRQRRAVGVAASIAASLPGPLHAQWSVDNGRAKHNAPDVNRFATKPRVTIADVARHAGVSKTTVSHVLSGNRPVASQTRTKVELAIEVLGYRPDGLARSLRTRRTHMIALIIPDITNPCYPVLARGLEHGMDGGGYRAFICNTDGSLDQELGFVEEVSDRRVDGIVLDSFHLSVHDLHAVTGGRMPVVWIGGTPMDHPGVDSVRPDDEGGAFAAVRHLIDRGHRRVAMIDGPPGSGVARRDGFERALREAGLPVDPERMFRGAWTRAGGTQVAERLFGLREPPTAVFCTNDLMALGVMDAAAARGMRVPGDLAIVGYDDIESAAMAEPPLTTVNNPAFETGRIAGVMLRERLTGVHPGEARSVTLPASLVVRSSS
jgi:LacI family transcriptional regulator